MDAIAQIQTRWCTNWSTISFANTKSYPLLLFQNIFAHTIILSIWDGVDGSQNHSFLLLKDQTQYNRDPKIQGRFLAHCHSLSFHFNVSVFHFHQYLRQKNFSNSFLSDVDLWLMGESLLPKDLSDHLYWRGICQNIQLILVLTSSHYLDLVAVLVYSSDSSR